jgi:hypothetical protein
MDIPPPCPCVLRILACSRTENQGPKHWEGLPHGLDHPVGLARGCGGGGPSAAQPTAGSPRAREAEGDIADAMACLDQAEGVIDGRGNPETFFAAGQPFGEGAQFGKTLGHYVTRRHRGQLRETAALPICGDARTARVIRTVTPVAPRPWGREGGTLSCAPSADAVAGSVSRLV